MEQKMKIWKVAQENFLPYEESKDYWTGGSEGSSEEETNLADCPGWRRVFYDKRSEVSQCPPAWSFVKAWRQLLATLGPVPLWAFLWQAGPWPLHRLVILPVLVSFCSLVHIIEHDDSLPPKCDVFYNLWRWVWVGRHLSSNDCETGAVSLSTYVAVHAMPVPTLGHGSC